MNPSGETLNTITKVRLPNGQDVGIVDWSWKPLYSTIDLLAGFSDLALYGFTYGMGDDVSMSANFSAAQQRTATLRDTNISSTSEMSSTEEMLVYGMSIEVYQFTLSGNNIVPTGALEPLPLGGNLAQLHERLIVELEVSEKAYYQASLGWFAAGFGVNVMTPAATTRTAATNGFQSREAMDRSPVPVHIGGTEKYKLIVHNPVGEFNFYTDAAVSDTDAVIRLRTNLVGLYKRPVG